MEIAVAQPESPIKQLRADLGIGRAGDLKRVGDAVVSADLGGTRVSDLTPLAGQALRKLDLRGTDVTDLSPVASHPIEELYVEATPITDIGPVAEMPLSIAYFSQTDVSDISALAGKSFRELNLVDTNVVDLKPLADCQFGTLWLRRSAVKDLSPLVGTGLVSLDVGETPVADITALASLPTLKRLHIAGTDVTDLRPLKDLRLERLVFSPWKIAEGLEVVRAMDSLQQLDTSFDDQSGQALRPEEFWKRWDAGDIKPPQG